MMAALVALVVLGIAGTYFPEKRIQVCILLCISLVGSLISVYMNDTDRPELIFTLIGFHIGLLFIILEPVAMNQSWDDQIHYQRALSISYGGREICSEGERALMLLQVNSDLPLMTQRETEWILQTTHVWGEKIHYHEVWPKVQSLSYLPMAMGLWLSRNIGLTLPWCVRAGKIGNLLCYLAVMASAIHFAPHKRTAMILGLMPTMLFMAANYSYDPWCAAWMTLGTVQFLRCFSADDSLKKKLPYREMLLAFFLACLTKQFYLPFFLICLFLPRSKFHTTREYRAYVTVTLCVFCVSLLLLLPPYFTNTLQVTDLRGGEGVNAVQQLHFTLSQPARYIKTLLRYVFLTFLSPLEIMKETVHLAYISGRGGGIPPIFGPVYLLIIILSFFQEGRGCFEQCSFSLLAISITCFLCSVFVIATTLYVSFTPVGCDTVVGCQIRYIYPLGISMLLIISGTIRYDGMYNRKMTLVFDIGVALYSLVCLFPLLYQVVFA